jgi:drug/metabolite transporter (DMT)-like permease
VTAALLALGAAACYGVSNFVGPRLVRNLPLYSVLVAGQLVALAVSGLLLMGDPGTGGPRSPAVAAAFAAGAGNAFGLICFYRAAELGPLSLVSPLASLGAGVPVLVGVASGDELGAIRLAGIAFAMVGVALAARREDQASVSRTEHRRAAVAWALLSSACFGVFLAGMSPAAEPGIFWAVFLSRVSVVGIFLGVALAGSSALWVRPADIPRVMVPGLLLFAGTLLYTQATQEGDLSVVGVLGSLFPVFTAALAFTLLGERLTRGQAVGVVAAMLGSVLLAYRP